MLCNFPYVKDNSGRVWRSEEAFKDPSLKLLGVPFPCGQCLPCRINRARIWTTRMILELAIQKKAVFVTLTYAPEFYPENGSLDKSVAQKFMKRLRYYCGFKVRYFLCGEYGDQSQRAHYHAIIFGLDLSQAELVAKSWQFGRVQVAECNRFTIRYVAGYVTKKLTPSILNGRQKEFQLMSRRPALGRDSVDLLAKIAEQNPNLFDGKYMREIRYNGKKMPLGRYLSNKLEEELELCCEEDYKFLKDVEADYYKALKEGKNLVSYLLDESKQKNLQIQTRFKIFNSRSKI